jgi:hypothetical protein
VNAQAAANRLNQLHRRLRRCLRFCVKVRDKVVISALPHIHVYICRISLTIGREKSFRGQRERSRTDYLQEVSRMRGYDKEFQKQVEAYMDHPPGTHNQHSEKDRHDKMEKRETRLDSNNR